MTSKTIAALTPAALLASGLALPTAAQIVPTGTPAADILLSQAIAEHRTFLTCSALDLPTHRIIVDSWLRDTAEASVILAEQGVPAAAITAFVAASRMEALMPAEDTPFAAIRALCAATPGWQAAYFEFRMIFLKLKLPQVFE